MSRTNYSAEFKAKIVIEVIEGTRTLEEIAAANNLNPNMVRTWKKEFIENAGRVFSDKAEKRETKRKEAEQAKERSQMLKTIGQLTLERDFLRDCFRKTGQPIEMPNFGSEEQ